MFTKICLSKLTVAVLCVSIMIFISFNAFADMAQSPSEFKQNFKANDDGSYTLYDNYAEFDGTVYEYNLNKFFPNSELTVYTYQITSDFPETGAVEIIEEDILRIIPHAQTSDEIIITATGSGGEVFETKFKLSFIDCSKYEMDKAITVIWIALGIFLVFLIITFGIPVNGGIRYAYGNCKPHSVRYNHGVAIIDKCSPVRGIILGRGGKFVYLVFFGNVYKDENRRQNIAVVKLRLNEDIMLYAEEQGKSINISFYR